MTPPPSAALLEQLMALHSVEMELTLDRVYRLLDALGNPHTQVPPVIHIAGTNGKGSTLAMLRAGLTSAGQQVHAYTSPHLVHFHERIVLAGQEISEASLCDVLTRVIAANDGQPITYFEATTCAAFLAFAETPADVLLLEVGMGGRGDTTNVIDAPLLTVITPVAYDHEDFLGHELGQIAREKAGILKRGVPCVVARQEDAALDVIEREAARLAAPLSVHGQHWHVMKEHGRLTFQDERGLLDLALPALPGPHQIENAGTSLAALRHLRHPEEVCEAALRNAIWPARMQRLTDGKLIEGAPGVEIWLDGGHNAHAAAAIATTLDGLPKRKTHLIFGLLNNRDAAAYLEPLVTRASGLTAVPIPGEPSSSDPEDLARVASGLGLSAGTAESVATALDRFGTDAPDGRVIICGSLYLAGSVLRDNG